MERSVNISPPKLKNVSLPRIVLRKWKDKPETGGEIVTKHVSYKEFRCRKHKGKHS